MTQTLCGFDIKQDYFEWLCTMIHADSDQAGASWWMLMKDLHRRTFSSSIPHDDNRASDGIELREEYLRDIYSPKYVSIDGECSILEMLIALAKRIDFEMSTPSVDNIADKTAYWFWEMLDNLGLTVFDDENYIECGGKFRVDAIIDNFLNRNYTWSGYGGLFPLRHSQEDQRNVEIWYQMSAYLAEREII